MSQMRYFRRTDTGAWYAGTHRTEGVFPSSGQVDADAIGAAIGLAAGVVAPVTVTDPAADPRSGVPFAEPVVPPTPAEAQFAADKADVVDFFTDAGVDAFLAAANGTATAAQRDAVIKRTMRALRSLARATRYAVSQLKD